MGEGALMGRATPGSRELPDCFKRRGRHEERADAPTPTPRARRAGRVCAREGEGRAGRVARGRAAARAI